MTTDLSTDAVATLDSAGPTTEACSLCGATLQLEPGQTRFEAVVAHFETEHVETPRVD